MQGEDENAGNGLKNLGKLLAQKAATTSPNIQAISSNKEAKDTSAADEAVKRPIISSGNNNRNRHRRNNRPKNNNK